MAPPWPASSSAVSSVAPPRVCPLGLHAAVGSDGKSAAADEAGEGITAVECRVGAAHTITPGDAGAEAVVTVEQRAGQPRRGRVADAGRADVAPSRCRQPNFWPPVQALRAQARRVGQHAHRCAVIAVPDEDLGHAVAQAVDVEVAGPVDAPILAQLTVQSMAGTGVLSGTPRFTEETLFLCQDCPMKALLRVFPILHGFMAILFACAALMLITIATKVAWLAFVGGLDRSAAQTIIEAVGLLAAAVVALQIAQTIAEEEVVRDTHISGPTRVRRFLSRFLVVIVVALTIEGLVATFRAAHEDPAHLLYAASIVLSAGVLLAGWGVFVRFNGYAEELEPEAMAEAKREDKKLK